MQDFIHPDWQQQFKQLQLNTTENFWQLNVPWLDAQNIKSKRRSGVKIYHVGTQKIYIKLEHCNKNTWWQKIYHRSLLKREYRNLLALHRLSIMVPQLIYYSTHKYADTVLVTVELTDYYDLPTYLTQHGMTQQLINALASAVRNLHAHGYCHGNLYPKHIFIKPNMLHDTGYNVAFIDLERTSYSPFGNYRLRRDLDTLNRHAPLSTNLRHRYDFLNYYFAGNRSKIRVWWRKLARLQARTS